MALAHTAALVKENDFLQSKILNAETNETYWRESHDATVSILNDLQKRFSDVQAVSAENHNIATTALAEIAQLQALSDYRTISKKQMDSLKRLSADLECAKMWGRDNSERVIHLGGLPEPEPNWQSAGHNLLHPEDISP